MADQESTTFESVEQPSQFGTADVLTPGAVDKGSGAATIEATPAPTTTTPPSQVGRTYTVDEWNKRQSALDSRMAELEKQLKAAQAERVAYETKLQEQEDARFIQRIQEGGGDVDAAKALVAQQKAVRERAREAEAKSADVRAREQSVAQAIKHLAADKFIKDYGLKAEDAARLITAKNPVEMENIALKLSMERQKTAQRPAQKVDPGTGQAAGVDVSKMSPSEKIRFALQTQSGK